MLFILLNNKNTMQLLFARLFLHHYMGYVCRAKTCFQSYADSEGPDQPANPRSVIRALAFCERNHCIQQNV